MPAMPFVMFCRPCRKAHILEGATLASVQKSTLCEVLTVVSGIHAHLGALDARLAFPIQSA